MANRMIWEFDTETHTRSKLVGFDTTLAVSHNKGKPEAIRELRQRHPYQNVVMVGDGITDLEAVQETGAADLFIGYGGAVVRLLFVSGFPTTFAGGFRTSRSNCKWLQTFPERILHVPLLLL